MSIFNSISPRNLGSWSVGAILGLAAVVFSWRLLRSRSSPKRSIPQPATINYSVEVKSPFPSTAGLLSEALRAQNNGLEFFQSFNATLGQAVRRKLRGKKVTCRLLGVILEENTPQELKNQATVRSSVLEVLSKITQICDLYLVEGGLDEESEQKVLAALGNAGAFRSVGLVKDKVHFCSAETSFTSFVQQREPNWHIDSNAEIFAELARFINYGVHVSPTKLKHSHRNVLSSTSLEQFFGSV
ncbi:unnamed protein product [Linum trigynum]|uniref:Peroxisome biogenesis protein 22 n=1 Tax=Linum trigynum TaxID=586398 RepID=A0AAV2FQB4_9ROSI